jgi:hypothetical protein
MSLIPIRGTFTTSNSCNSLTAFSSFYPAIWLLEIFPLKSLGSGIGGDGGGIDGTGISKRRYDSSTQSSPPSSERLQEILLLPLFIDSSSLI